MPIAGVACANVGVALVSGKISLVIYLYMSHCICILDLYLYVFLFILHFIPGSLHVIDTRTLTPHRVGAGGVKVRECRGPAKVGEEYGD